jgi:hypothetical protein
VYSPSGTTISCRAKHPITVHLAALGAPTLTYLMVAGPSSMTIDATTGVVTWTPTDLDANSNPYAIFQVKNSTGTSAQLVIYFPVAPNLPVIRYTSPDLVGGTLYASLKSAFSMTLSDSFSHSSITWAVLDGPSGLSVNPSTGAVTWTPAAGTEFGPYTATFQATNYAGSVTLTVPLTVTFAAAPGNFQASNLNSTTGSATLSWSASAVSSSPVSDYRITVSYVNAAGVLQTQTFLVSGTTTTFKLSGLPHGTTFQVSVAALDALGDLGTPSWLSFQL